MADPGLRLVTLASATDLDGFRRACRRLRAERVAPEQVVWTTADGAAADRLGAEPSAVDASSGEKSSSSDSAAPAITAPAAFLPLCERVILHADPLRFALLYRLLWRFAEEPGLRHNPLDPDRVQAVDMAEAVQRDLHQMKASVRFRPLPIRPPANPLLVDHVEAPGLVAEPSPWPEPRTTLRASPLQHGPLKGLEHIAWFEPEHHIVETVAPFFAQRLAPRRWALLTPKRSVRGDGEALEFGPGADRSQAPPAEADAQRWLDFCERLFNPARVQRVVMARETLQHGAHARLETGADPALPHALKEIAAAINRCRECPLGALATQAVPGEGPQPHARLMVVGEQPGDQEDLRGRPFVGPAGQLLDRAFAQLGWSRQELYITNAVKHFKFEWRGQRRIHQTPSPQEAAACLHWLEDEINALQPHAVIALGATAARQLMGRPIAVTRQRGQWLKRANGLAVLITLHPSALLRLEPGDKAAAYEAWLADLQKASHCFVDTQAAAPR